MIFTASELMFLQILVLSIMETLIIYLNLRILGLQQIQLVTILLYIQMEGLKEEKVMMLIKSTSQLIPQLSLK